MACLSAGRIDEAARHAEEALTISRSRRMPHREADALCLSGDVASKRGTGGAEGYYRRALALGVELGMRPLVAHCHLGLGKLYRQMGNRGQAQEQLAIAAAMYQEMNMASWLQQAKEEIHRLA
jgi:hypothetical protein